MERVLSSLQLLSELEASVPGGVVSRVSWLAGTSTGAILALALSKGFTIDECRRLYFRFKVMRESLYRIESMLSGSCLLRFSTVSGGCPRALSEEGIRAIDEDE